MCGIAGQFAYSPSAEINLAALRLARDEMQRRGPDGAGEWIGQGCRIALMHRRLAIIDLDLTSNQPLTDSSARYVIVFNGEIYNYKDIRAQLVGLGYLFKTNGDTEVILNAYREWGVEAFRRLRGMFALAIWDTRENSLTLARDSFGIKPLYFAVQGGVVSFCSQVEPLTRILASTSPDPAGHVGFLLWGFVPDPFSMYSEIRSIPAGHSYTFGASGEWKANQFFSLPTEILDWEESARANRLTAGEKIELVRSAMDDAVRAHFVSDVPVGIFLSAGLDSTAICRSAANTIDSKIISLTLGIEEYRGTSHDETALAKKTAHTYGTKHVEHWVSRSDFASQQPAILASMDQPSIDGVNTYYVSMAARSVNLKVALSGLGGDELFASYPSFDVVPRISKYIGRVPISDRLAQLSVHFLQPVARRSRFPKLSNLLFLGRTLEGAYQLKRGLFMPNEIHRLLPENYVRQGIEALDTLPTLRRAHEAIHNKRLKVAAMELSHYMRSQLLRDVDWASMAHSVEVRVPFMDVPFCRAVAPAIAGEVHPEKAALFDLGIAGHMTEINTRPKTGFVIPVSGWRSPNGKKPAPTAGAAARLWALEILRKKFRARRILALVTDGYGGRGGIAKFNRDLLDSFSSYSDLGLVTAVPRIVIDPAENVPPRIVWQMPGARGKLWFLLTAIAAAVGKDTLICGHINFLPLSAALKRLTGVELILVIHGVEAWKPPRSKLVIASIPHIDRVIAVSSFSAEKFSSWSGLPQEIIEILPNCVDLERYRIARDPRDMRARLKLQGSKVLLTVARLASKERYKGIDEVLDILPRLRKSIPNIRYVIAGEGEDRGRLERRVDELKLNDVVQFAGFVSEEDKATLYYLADVYVMPSRGEGFGIVFIEALASGLPVIGSRLDGGREALMGGRLGILVDPSDQDELITAIQKSLTQPRQVPAALVEFSKQAFERRVHRILDRSHG